VLSIAWPVASLADPPADQNKDEQHGHQKGGQGMILTMSHLAKERVDMTDV
jgi:hypothetical protein